MQQSFGFVLGDSSCMIQTYKVRTQDKLDGSTSCQKNVYTKNQINTAAAADIRMSAAKPRMFDRRLLANLPMMVLLLQICSIMPIITGAVMPYKTADHNNAFTGLIPRNCIPKPINSDRMMVI